MIASKLNLSKTLSSIEECVNDKCLPKTEFEWEESDESNTSQENT
jgi:hypothetical protein